MLEVDRVNSIAYVPAEQAMRGQVAHWDKPIKPQNGVDDVGEGRVVDAGHRGCGNGEYGGRAAVVRVEVIGSTETEWGVREPDGARIRRVESG